MLVCVTGGTGFLGSYLVRDLLARGTNVRVLARPSPRADRLAAAGVEIAPGDLRDPESIARAVRGADIVYHLAAKVGAAPYKDYFEINVGGTERVVKACTENGVGQFVYASSLAVYGPVAEGTASTKVLRSTISRSCAIPTPSRKSTPINWSAHSQSEADCRP